MAKKDQIPMTPQMKWHQEAMDCPSGHYEKAILDLWNGLTRYGIAHRNKNDYRLATDYVLGNAWLAMARALVALLGGEHGRLDAGTIDGNIRANAISLGFDDSLDEK